MKVEYIYQLFPATVVKSYNSLIIDVKLTDDSVVPAFCSRKEINSICEEGMAVWVKRSTNPRRIIKYKIEYVNKDGKLIFTSPRFEEDLFKEAFDKGRLSEFVNYNECRRIASDDHLPHIDFELSNDSGEKCYVFIKTLFGSQGNRAVFPIDTNFYEQEMFEEMRKLRMAGHKTCFFMIVPQEDCQEAHFVWSKSPIAAAKLYDEAKNGLQFACYRCNVSKMNVGIADKIEITY